VILTVKNDYATAVLLSDAIAEVHRRGGLTDLRKLWSPPELATQLSDLTNYLKTFLTTRELGEVPPAGWTMNVVLTLRCIVSISGRSLDVAGSRVQLRFYPKTADGTDLEPAFVDLFADSGTLSDTVVDVSFRDRFNAVRLNGALATTQQG